MFDLEAQRKSSASIGRLLGLAKDETGVRAPDVHVLGEPGMCWAARMTIPRSPFGTFAQTLPASLQCCSAVHHRDHITA